MTVYQVFDVLWRLALAYSAIGCLASLVRDGQVLLALAAVVVPIGLAVLARVRGRSNKDT